MRSRRDIQQVKDIAKSESRFLEGLVVKVFPQTRTAQVRLDGSSQYTMVNLGHIDPFLVSAPNSRVLLYKSGQSLYAISCMPGLYAPSSAGVTLGDRWGSTELTIYSSRTTYATPTYDVAAIDSLGNVRYCGDLMPVRGDPAIKYAGYSLVPLTTPLTNTSFGGDSFSDVSTSTKIENTSWSTTIPSDARALLLKARVRDSGSAATAGLYFACGGSVAQWAALVVSPSGKANDDYEYKTETCPCTDGDIWYQISASDTNTMDVWLECYGYWI